jgi:hypothetical protein
MQDLSTQASSSFFKRIDKELFERLDKFKQTPAYNNIQDFYNGLDEEQQKLFKATIIGLIFLIPVLFLIVVSWSNSSLKANLDHRVAMIQKANEIIGKRQSLRSIAPDVLASNPIDGESMMTSRLSTLLSSTGIDLSKIQVKNYEGNMTSETIMRSEADFQFNNISTDELVNIFTTMIQREKFRVESLEITRNADTNLLQGTFHAIHLSNAQPSEEE